jgi:hypothetical protein
VVAREPELIVGGVHGGHGVVRAEVGVAWRAKKKTTGSAEAAAGRKMTRGVAGEQEVALSCSDGERR